MGQTRLKRAASNTWRNVLGVALCGACGLWPVAALAQQPLETAGEGVAQEEPSAADGPATGATDSEDSTPQNAEPSQEPTSEATPQASPPEAAPAPSPAMDDELRRQLETIQAQLADLQARMPETEDGGSGSEAEPKPVEPTLPVGRWYLGGTLGLNFDNANNTNRVFGKVVDDHRTSMSLEALTGTVVVEDKVAVGLTAGFTRSKLRGEFEASEGIETRRNLEYRIDVGPVVRGLVRLDPAGRFYIFYDTSLQFGWGESVKRTFSEASSTVTTGNLYALSLGLRPGLMVFATPSFAIELGVEVLGAEARWDKTTLDYDEKGSRVRADVDLDLNLLSLSFAFVGYFG